MADPERPTSSVPPHAVPLEKTKEDYFDILISGSAEEADRMKRAKNGTPPVSAQDEEYARLLWKDLAARVPVRFDEKYKAARAETLQRLHDEWLHLREIRTGQLQRTWTLWSIAIGCVTAMISLLSVVYAAANYYESKTSAPVCAPAASSH